MLATAVAICLLAGCGSDSSSSETTTSTTKPRPTTTQLGPRVLAFCGLIDDYNATFDQFSADSIESIREGAGQTLFLLSGMEDQAPRSLVDPIGTIKDAASELQTAAEGTDDLDAVVARIGEVQTPEVDAATKAVQDYSASTCPQ